MSYYKFIAWRVPNKLALVEHNKYGQQVWSTTSVGLRTHKKCEVTGEDLYGKIAFSPITNGYNRMERISQYGMQFLSQNDQP